MKTIVTLLLLLSSVSATTYYISPSGSDSNAGTSSGSPFKTFSHAIPLLTAGDTLNLLNGTYSVSAGTGLPNINCSSGAHSGTSGSPVTIQALNERQAFLQGTGPTNTLTMIGCSYWIVAGLRSTEPDYPWNGSSCTSQTATHNFYFTNTHHLIVRRNLADHENRCGNSHEFDFVDDSAPNTQNLVEENEAYCFHREPFVDYQNGVTGTAYNGIAGGGSEFRRNYANGRGCVVTLSGGWPKGATSVIGYSVANDLFENNIGEGSDSGVQVQCSVTSPVQCQFNAFLGNITFSTGHAGGASGAPYNTSNSSLFMPNHELFDNDVWVNIQFGAIAMRAVKAVTIKNNTVIGGGTNGSTLGSYNTDSNGNMGDGNMGPIVFQNSIATGVSGKGFGLDTSFGSTTWTFDHDDSYNNSGGSYSPASNLVGSLTTNPSLGSCYLWVPDASPMKGAGVGGADIGANVLYAYEGGVLTSNKLWDSSTGAPTFKGATVGGVNDSSALIDIANRLNIGKNGCNFPASYVGTVSKPLPPTGLTAIVH